LAYRFEHGAANPDLLMTVHARFGWRNAGKCGSLDRGMTVAAIDAELADVVGVTERHGLDKGDVRLSNVGGPIKHGREPAQASRDEDSTENRHLGNGVETSVEDLGHRCHLTRSCGESPVTLRSLASLLRG